MTAFLTLPAVSDLHSHSLYMSPAAVMVAPLHLPALTRITAAGDAVGPMGLCLQCCVCEEDEALLVLPFPQQCLTWLSEMLLFSSFPLKWKPKP